SLYPKTICLLAILWALCDTARGGLSRPPSSSVEPLPDGKHMLVRIAPLPADEDEGRMAVLPDGQIVDLRETFPASGCYPINSTTPLWTAPWEEIDRWTVSDDCRYLVRWNRFGDGSYGREDGGILSWGLKFYDRGKEIKAYSVAELVDYPSLMPYTSADWHFDWLADGFEDSLIIKDGLFLLRTSTHERYSFDVKTGEIVEQFRIWRRVTWTGIGLALALAGSAILVLRGRRHARLVVSSGTDVQWLTAANIGPAARTRLSSYSLRTLLITTTVIAILCVVGRKWPHADVLIVSFLLTAALTVATIRHWRRARPPVNLFNRRLAISGLSLVTVLACLWCYLLSAGPVIATLDWLDAPHDVKWAFLLTVYRPLIWVETLSPLSPLDRWPLLEWYFAGWGIR
ncbi:MAG TPA: hypothetical protein VJ828_03515, partial [Lacipirellulaceae bacterium]|nr:hypothetical protein [Lacipirellulaceae bacterium]